MMSSLSLRCGLAIPLLINVLIKEQLWGLRLLNK